MNAASVASDLDNRNPISRLAVARRAKRKAVMYSVYGDESHEGKQQRVFAIAGLFGSQDDWDETGSLWISRTGGKMFHAADCESDHGEYAGINHEENLALYRDLTKIIANSKLCGRGVALDLAGSREFFPDILPQSDYHKCFMELLVQFGELASLSIPQDRIKFTFDQRSETDHSAAALYDYLTKQPEWTIFPYFQDEISFATRKTTGIQMADLLARETMKELDRRVQPTGRDVRKSMRAFAEKPYRFQFRYFMRDYFADFKHKFGELEASARLKMNDDYWPWLEKAGLTDCWTARIRYATYVDSLERLAANKINAKPSSDPGPDVV